MNDDSAEEAGLGSRIDPTSAASSQRPAAPSGPIRRIRAVLGGRTAEKRRFPRKKRRFLVEFHMENGGGQGFTYDVSPSGIFVRSVRIPNPGTSIVATLHLLDGKTCDIRGTVVRSFRAPASLSNVVPSGFGLQLADVPEDYFQFLASL
ncbi:MAG TPA: PilZ domain-containing protein [Thermoanaerobaculia bacterium]